MAEEHRDALADQQALVGAGDSVNGAELPLEGDSAADLRQEISPDSPAAFVLGSPDPTSTGFCLTKNREGDGRGDVSHASPSGTQNAEADKQASDEQKDLAKETAKGKPDKSDKKIKPS